MEDLNILTENLSDPSLTQLPVVAPGTYEVIVSKPRLLKEEGQNGEPVSRLAYTVYLQSPALKYGTNEPWPPSMPVPTSIQLTPTGKLTQQIIKQNLASFLQACGEATLLTPQEAGEFASMLPPAELPIPKFEGKKFMVKISVRPDSEGNPRMNLRPVPTRR